MDRIEEMSIEEKKKGNMERNRRKNHLRYKSNYRRASYSKTCRMDTSPAL